MGAAVVCPGCGKRVPVELARCPSCGSALDAAAMSLPGVGSDEVLAEQRRSQQHGFRWRWVLGSLAIFLAVQMAPLWLLGLDGWLGLGLSVAVWFVGGLVVGFVSPGKTIFEPAVASLLCAPPTILYLHLVTPAGLGPSSLAYAAGGIVGVGLGLFGALLGEAIQDLTQG